MTTTSIATCIVNNVESYVRQAQRRYDEAVKNVQEQASVGARQGRYAAEELFVAAERLDLLSEYGHLAALGREKGVSDEQIVEDLKQRALYGARTANIPRSTSVMKNLADSIRQVDETQLLFVLSVTDEVEDDHLYPVWAQL